MVEIDPNQPNPKQVKKNTFAKAVAFPRAGRKLTVRQVRFDAVASAGVMMGDNSNPCMSCGACCAWFRVSFYWAEGDDGGGTVPNALTETLTPFLRCMRGTNDRRPRCHALEGEVGEAVRCTIYAGRPSPCREFAMAGEGGQPNDACDRARAHYGLPPLSPRARDVLNKAEKRHHAAAGCQPDR